MKDILIQMLALQIILIFALILVFMYLLRARRYYLFEKRIAKYTLSSLSYTKISLGDKLFKIFNNILSGLSKILKKSQYLKTHERFYVKYSTVNSTRSKSIYEIYAFKIILAFVFASVYILSAAINNAFSYISLLIFVVVGFYIYNLYLSYSFSIRKKRIEADLLKAIIIMNNAFKSGYNIMQAINIVINNLTGPIKEEFIKINNDIKYGLDLSEVFDQFYERVQIQDAKYITSSLSLLNETGGNLTGIFNSIEISFTNKKRLHDELIAMTSSSNLIYRILIAIPFVLVGFILIVNPTYFNALFTNVIGFLSLFIAIVLLIGYIIVIKKILKVDL